MAKLNINLNDGFTQVCIWTGTVVGEEVDDFIKLMKDKFSTRIQYLEEILTAPDYENGKPVEDTGGRNDLFFAVHQDDVMSFATARLQYGIRWIEDAVSKTNGGNTLYPERVEQYCSWDA